MITKNDSKSLVSVIDGLFRTFYSNGGKRILRTLGFERPAKRLYARLLLSVVDDIRTVSIDDVSASFRVSSPFEFDLFYNEGYNNEEAVLRDVLSHLESDDVFYDVGAHVGSYAIFAANALDEGKAIGFEPHPENRQCLQENAALNNGRIESYRYALSDTEGRSEFAASGNAAEATGALHEGHTADGQTVSVETVPGDVLIDREEVPPPNVIKIDVEGAELDVIHGLQSTLERRTCRIVYCECHPDELRRRGHATDAVERTLESLGFETEQIHDRGDQPFVRAQRNQT